MENDQRSSFLRRTTSTTVPQTRTIETTQVKRAKSSRVLGRAVTNEGLKNRERRLSYSTNSEERLDTPKMNLKEVSQKALKALEEFWKKICDRKDLSGTIDSKLPLFWYTLWKGNFDPLVMVKNFDLYQFEIIGEKGRSISTAHTHMSRWFALAWDQGHKGLLDWYDFSHGWFLTMHGGDREVLSLLFRAIDKDNDNYINCEDTIEYCRAALQNADNISKESIENTIKYIFDDMDREGPFDVISEGEFIEYAEKNPDSVFAIWGRVLQWKKIISSYSPPTTPVQEGPLKHRWSTSKQMQRSKTDVFHGSPKVEAVIMAKKEKEKVIRAPLPQKKVPCIEIDELHTKRKRSVRSLLFSSPLNDRFIPENDIIGGKDNDPKN